MLSRLMETYVIDVKGIKKVYWIYLVGTLYTVENVIIWINYLPANNVNNK